MALVVRGVTKDQLGDAQGAIADYTAVIELEGAPKEPVAEALLGRGVAKGQLDDVQGAIADYTTVIELEGAPKEQLARALVSRGVSKWQLGDARVRWPTTLPLSNWRGRPRNNAPGR